MALDSDEPTIDENWLAPSWLHDWPVYQSGPVPLPAAAAAAALSTSAKRSLHACSTPRAMANGSMASNSSGVRAGACAQLVALGGGEVHAEAVDLVHHQPPGAGRLLEQVGEDPVHDREEQQQRDRPHRGRAAPRAKRPNTSPAKKGSAKAVTMMARMTAEHARAGADPGPARRRASRGGRSRAGSGRRRSRSPATP